MFILSYPSRIVGFPSTIENNQPWLDILFTQWDIESEQMIDLPYVGYSINDPHQELNRYLLTLTIPDLDRGCLFCGRSTLPGHVTQLAEIPVERLAPAAWNDNTDAPIFTPSGVTITKLINHATCSSIIYSIHDALLHTMREMPDDTGTQAS